MRKGTDDRARQRAGAEGEGLRLVRARRGEGETAVAQLRRPGRLLWDEAVRQEFLEVLAATCNVREASRAVGMTDRSAYKLRQRDAAFAAAWDGAVEQGYSELEMLLLRQSLHGSTTTETVEDGEGQCKQVKTRHSYPLDVAARLLIAHRKTAEAVRDQQGAQPGAEQIRAEIQVQIAAVRARVSMVESEDGNGNA